MPESEGEFFYVVVADPIDRTGEGVSPDRANAPRAAGVDPADRPASAPTVSAQLRSTGLEIFPMPDSDTDRIEWVESPSTALLKPSDLRRLGHGRQLQDRAGTRFQVRRIERLAAIPQGRLNVMHRPPAGAAPFDIVLLAEGYAAADEAAFATAAARLGRDFIQIEPYRSCRDRLRVAALFLPSPESGINEENCGGSQHSQVPCPAVNQRRRTLFGTSNMVRNYCRLIAGNEDRVRQALAADHIRDLLAGEGIRPRLAVVVANTKVYGGAGAADANRSPLVVWTAPTAEGGAVMAHEMGHALGLQDEYEDRGTGLPDPDAWVNISREADPSRTPWHCRVTDQDGPYPTCSHHDPACECGPSVIGTFEGAGHSSAGRYRPTKNCGMRTTGHPFCPICTTHISNRLSGVPGGVCPSN